MYYPSPPTQTLTAPAFQRTLDSEISPPTTFPHFLVSRDKNKTAQGTLLVSTECILPIINKVREENGKRQETKPTRNASKPPPSTSWTPSCNHRQFMAHSTTEERRPTQTPACENMAGREDIKATTDGSCTQNFLCHRQPQPLRTQLPSLKLEHPFIHFRTHLNAPSKQNHLHHSEA